MISLSASSPTLISDLNHTFSAGLTSLISPGDLFTVEDIQASNDMEMALTAGTINVIDGNGIKLSTIKNVGMGDVSSGYGLMKEISVSDQCLTVSATTVTITGSLNLSGNTFNSIGPFYQTGESLFTGNLCVVDGVISATTIILSGTPLETAPSSQPIISLTSTYSTPGDIIVTTPLICPWDVETTKDVGFTHSNVTDNTKIIVDDDGTYQIAANIRVEDNGDQRTQMVCKILINGSPESGSYGSGYIRNAGQASDLWSSVVNPPPIKLEAGDEIEVQVQLEDPNPVSYDADFIGAESSFSVIKLSGTKGNKGDSGTLDNNSGIRSDSFSGLTTEAVYYGDGTNLTGVGSQQDRQSVSDADVITTTGTWIDIDLATLTTGNLGENGDYIVTFGMTFDNDNEDPIHIRIMYDGVGIDDSERTKSITNHEANQSYTLSTSAYIADVPDNKVIKSQIYVDNGNVTIYKYTLIIDGIKSSNNIS